MPFPTSNISATSIRTELAANNTGGVQTPVTLNDVAVRAAANRPSGTVSFNDLRGVNVVFSGLITFGRRILSPFPGTVIRLWGFFPDFTPTFGGPIGSLNTASYYRTAPANTGRLISFGYDDSSASGGGTQNISDIIFQGFPATPVNNVSVNFDGTRITAVPSRTTVGGWTFTGDPFGFESKGNNGETYQIVITYT
jgi:hypothetical protein